MSANEPWYKKSPLEACVGWLDKAAREIARRDPPANGPDLYLTDHGVPHIDGVLRHARVLALRPFAQTVLPEERATLYAAVVCHDIGLWVHPPGLSVQEVRDRHAEFSSAWLLDLAARANGASPLTPEYARLLASIVRAHRRATSLSSVEERTLVPTLTMPIRGRLIASWLRLADGLDIGPGRAPTAIYRYYGTRIPKGSEPYWRAHQSVTGAELDIFDGNIVLHLADGASLEDVRELYLAIQSEVDLIPRELLRMNACHRPAIVFKRGDEVITPGRAYAELLTSGGEA